MVSSKSLPPVRVTGSPRCQFRLVSVWHEFFYLKVSRNWFKNYMVGNQVLTTLSNVLSQQLHIGIQYHIGRDRFLWHLILYQSQDHLVFLCNYWLEITHHTKQNHYRVVSSALNPCRQSGRIPWLIVSNAIKKFNRSKWVHSPPFQISVKIIHLTDSCCFDPMSEPEIWISFRILCSWIFFKQPSLKRKKIM